MRVGILFVISILLAAIPAFGRKGPAPADAVVVSAKWIIVERVSDTIPTTQHLANALALLSNPLNKSLLKDLRNLHTNDARLQLWFSIPNQVVAELKEPSSTETFWNSRHMDSVVIAYFANTNGQRHTNIGTIPRWMTLPHRNS